MSAPAVALAARINAEHDQAQQAARTAIEHAIDKIAEGIFGASEVLAHVYGEAEP